MSTELWLAFVAASAVLLIIPGLTILTVISYAVTRFWQRSTIRLEHRRWNA